MTDQNRDILCEDLFKIYRASGIDVVALRGLDLTINSGEMISELLINTGATPHFFKFFL